MLAQRRLVEREPGAQCDEGDNHGTVLADGPHRLASIDPGITLNMCLDL